ncbi:uncharacterized oxidoreductase TM_0325-like [Sitodiplosis mosellana]|uniref:uncharacterized oxidoreductase TM_0325-like n=1 Tax=Sitodiplosis mosellana TaxID=263140 RepID=UPI0024438652|nr:uncharacterized oxidoreductase TM_0325-like [Sitodiplosis mosellana]
MWFQQDGATCHTAIETIDLLKAALLNFPFATVSKSKSAHAAEHLAQKSGSIALVGRNTERLNEVCDRIKNAGAPTPLLIVADVSSEAERIITETIKHFGKLDILINNAGILSRDTIETVDLDEYERIIKTNYACNAITKSTALDLAPKVIFEGIRVNAFNPCVIKTGILTSGFRLSSEQADEFVDSLKNVYPVGRAGECTDTSAAIEYLISDSASFLTEILLPVDGGEMTKFHI